MSSRQFKGQFRSPVGSLMEQFVQQKQACGYRYGEQAHLLARFDRFLCDEALSQCELPRSISRKWLAKQRHESSSTHQHRLGIVRQFAMYMCRLGYPADVPDRSLTAKCADSFSPRILTPAQIQQLFHAVDQLTPTARAPLRHLIMPEVLAQVLAQPDPHTRAGRRDAVLLSVLYDTGARVQELIDLNAGDVRLDPPPQVRLMGKGRKMRAVPLMDATVELLRDHRRDNNLDRPEHADKPFFQNRQGARLSRSGVRYLLQKYVQPVRRDHPGFTQPVSPHSLRHTKGMHLLQSGVPLEIIRDFLGHVDVKTTEIYARANLEMKRKALEKAADVTPLPKIPSWKQNKTLLEWLHSL